MSLQIEYNSYLEHHGVKGMRWGIRKQQRYEKKERRKALRRVKSMSDDELNKRIQRLRKEKELRELTESEVTKGRSAVKKILIGTATTVGAAALTGATMHALHNIKNGLYSKETHVPQSPKVTSVVMENGKFKKLDTPIYTARPDIVKSKTRFSIKKYGEAFKIGEMIDSAFSKKKK